MISIRDTLTIIKTIEIIYIIFTENFGVPTVWIPLLKLWKRALDLLKNIFTRNRNLLVIDEMIFSSKRSKLICLDLDKPINPNIF